MLIALFVLLGVCAPPGGPGGAPYVVDAAASEVRVRVGRSGLFKFAGHEHEVRAPVARGEVRVDEPSPQRSTVSLEFESARLRVSGKGEPPEDVPKVQESMAGPRVLDVARFPSIRFASRIIEARPLSPGVYELKVTGDLTLRAASRPLTIPLRLEISPERLLATGTAAVRQTDFGIEPLSVGGVVNVKNELAVAFRVVATRSSR